MSQMGRNAARDSKQWKEYFKDGWQYIFVVCDIALIHASLKRGKVQNICEMVFLAIVFVFR